MTDQNLVQLLLEAHQDPKISKLHQRQFDITNCTITDNMWKYDYDLDRLIFSFSAHVKYRFQHNAYIFR